MKIKVVENIDSLRFESLMWNSFFTILGQGDDQQSINAIWMKCPALQVGLGSSTKNAVQIYPKLGNYVNPLAYFEKDVEVYPLTIAEISVMWGE